MKLLENLIIIAIVGLFCIPMFNAGAQAAPEARGTPPEAVKKAKVVSGIEWQVDPKDVVIYLDGKRLGTAGKLKFTKTRPGKHTVRLTLNKDESEMDIEVKKGQTLKFAFKFDQG